MVIGVNSFSSEYVCIHACIFKTSEVLKAFEEENDEIVCRRENRLNSALFLKYGSN